MKPLIIPAEAGPLHLKAYCKERFGQITINNPLSQASGHRVSLGVEGQLSIYTGKLIHSFSIDTREKLRREVLYFS